jgi:hypothetical protein
MQGWIPVESEPSKKTFDSFSLFPTEKEYEDFTCVGVEPAWLARLRAKSVLAPSLYLAVEFRYEDILWDYALLATSLQKRNLPVLGNG